jgi:hypothetical protein
MFARMHDIFRSDTATLGRLWTRKPSTSPECRWSKDQDECVEENS